MEGHYGGYVASAQTPESAPSGRERIDVDQHRSDVAAIFRHLLTESGRSLATDVVTPEQAYGRVLAVDARARAAVPAFRNSQMDGFVLRSRDADGPVRLPVSAEIAAGSAPGALEPGTAARIMTGAPIPEGGDAVVPVEDTDIGRFVPGERPASVGITGAIPAGQFVREAGSDVAMGDVIVRSGTLIGPAQVGALAACGAVAHVVPRPRVAVVSTGAEVVASDTTLAPGQVYDANGPALAAAAREAGAEVIAQIRCADDVAALTEALNAASEADVIITSGGVSQGAYEVVKDLLATGGEVTFRSVAMQPGGPQGWGTYRGTPIVTFPGNPVSAHVSFIVFLRDVLRAAAGLPAVTRGRMPLLDDVTSPAGKRQFLRGVRRSDGSVQVMGGPGSHLVATMALADVLIDVPSGVTALSAGDEVEVWPL